MRLAHIFAAGDDADLLHRFWTAALTSPEAAVAVGAVETGTPAGSPGRAVARGDREGRPPRGIGLRFASDGIPVEEEVARLVALGATVRRKYHNGWGLGEVVLADPCGNEFVVDSGEDADAVTHRLNTRDRGDGGPFWSDAVPPHALQRTTAVAHATISDVRREPWIGGGG